jgi:protein gp37
MADGSTIEWLQRPGTKPASWNPIRARLIPTVVAGINATPARIGWHCEHVHEGCRNCYAERLNLYRFGTGLAYKPGNQGKVEIYLDEDVLLRPLQWRAPRTIFVCSMTDPYGDWVKPEWRDRIKAIQALTPHHTYIELTKRPSIMRRYCASDETMGRVLSLTNALLQNDGKVVITHKPDGFAGFILPNVWGLVSISEQKDVDEFLPDLLATPLAVRGVSCEPLLGAIDLTSIRDVPSELRNALTGEWRRDEPGAGVYERDARRLDWVIVGGESGKDARPMHPQWARDLRDQCKAAGVPFFFKQWGEWASYTLVPGGDLGGETRAGRVRIVHPSGRTPVEISEATGGRSTEPGSRYMGRVGKKAAGRLLDGVEHSEFPEVRP